MQLLTPIVAVTAFAVGTLACAQSLDRPPAIKDAPRIESRGADAGAATPLAEPSASELLPPRSETQPQARIEQRHQGTRVSEIIVTPAGRTYSYTIQNREGQRPLSPQDLASGLSTPRFLKFEF